LFCFALLLVIASGASQEHSISSISAKPHRNFFQARGEAEWLPELDARRTSQLHIVHMVVKIYTRRSKRQLIRFGDPLPEKPIRAKRIIQNTIYEGLKIQAFINNGPGRITWAIARKELNISEAKLAHLLKIVKTLPPDFVERMKTCTDENMLKVFHGRRLLKISRLKTEKERRAEIQHLMPKA
jgi:hypothetical protein